MHEIGLLRAAVAALCTAADGPITQVTLALGVGVDQAAAAAAWQTTAEGTPAAGAAVTWEQGRDRLTCLSCGLGYDGDPLTRCPECRGNGLTVETAPEIVIVGFHDDGHLDARSGAPGCPIGPRPAAAAGAD